LEDRLSFCDRAATASGKNLERHAHEVVAGWYLASLARVDVETGTAARLEKGPIFARTTFKFPSDLVIIKPFSKHPARSAGKHETARLNRLFG
jgi:hypothetical protein